MTTLFVLKREGIRAGRAGPADLETIGQCFDLTVHGVAKLTQLCVVMPEVQKVNLQWLPTHALNCMLPHKNHTESDAVGEDSQLLTAVEWRILQNWECTPVILWCSDISHLSLAANVQNTCTNFRFFGGSRHSVYMPPG